MNCWCKHVLDYVDVDLWNSNEICFRCCRVLSSHTVVVGFHLHVGVGYLCIQLCGVFMQGVMMYLLH